VDIETAFILLFVVATAVAIAARRARLPYTVALVLAGLALGGLDLFPAPQLTKTLLFSVFLPGLIFEAAFHIDFREFRDNWITILSLAVPGVVASTALIAFILTPVIVALGVAVGFGWKHALVFGALISATDPVAVVGLFRNMGAPRRLTMLLDGESLLNDGTAIVFFTLSLSLLAGTDVTAGHLVLQFLSIVGVGAVIGAVIGVTASLLMRQIDDPMIEITLTTIAAYGSFVTAETAHASGVIATVAAGMLCGNFGARTGMSASTRVATETFWEYVAFALNSIVFLLIGFEVQLPVLFSYWLPILVAYLVVTVGRGLVIVGGRALVGLTRERFPWRWSIVLTWGGLRGALPMVLVLSLPSTFAYRELLVSMTFGVAVLSILVHGLTMSGVLTRLGIVSEPAERTAYEIRSGQLRAAAAALQELDRMSQMHLAAPTILDALREEYRRIVESTEKELQKLAANRGPLRDRDLYRIRRRLLITERDQVMQAFHHGTLGRKSQERLLADIDARLLRLETGQESDTSSPQSGGTGDAA
jgi:CPA1 family monovalent cation:H+ antiporter